ncbi:Myc-type [Macleaya cordata]|uniref:Myc-type n=1 Tax=Macleaya cordata TaxID=56857 RepID=A0A200QIL1_MACCD|nr:Myc-type [Macleaya cordata]
MELNEHGFLEELLELRRETWQTFPTGMTDQFIYNGSGFNCFNENPGLILPNTSLEGFAISTEPGFNYEFNEVYCPFEDEVRPVLDIDPSYRKNGEELPFMTQEDNGLILGNVESGFLTDDFHSFGEKQGSCKVELVQATKIPVVFEKDLRVERKNRVKKVEGQPSKNLMAERRRRKRLNDRLSMLRSVVPKISKMDRTSIVGDTIDYMKELIEKIKNLQQEIQVGSDQLNLISIFKELKQDEIIVRSSPKFDAERRDKDTRIEICCAGKPGVLLSSVTTLETLGLDIQQCVISCFNEFSMQASCSEELEQRTMTSTDEIKQALFRNAGYGGKCL